MAGRQEWRHHRGRDRDYGGDVLRLRLYQPVLRRRSEESEAQARGDPERDDIAAATRRRVRALRSRLTRACTLATLVVQGAAGRRREMQAQGLGGIGRVGSGKIRAQRRTG
jgi:hypothetical protein